MSHHEFSTASNVKEVAINRYQRRRRDRQDHGTRGTDRMTEVSDYWPLELAPRRVISAQPVDTSELLDEVAAHSQTSESESNDVDPFEYVAERGEIDALLDTNSTEYEIAYNQLSALLDRHGIKDEDRVLAFEDFERDSSLRSALLDIAYDSEYGIFATSYAEVDSANTLSARALTDYQFEGSFDDDNGDYHVPHMSMRR